MKVSAMVAMAANRVIGKDNDIPWRGKLKGEQLLFKKYTEGKTVIMGRKTWESIPSKYRPLPKRLNIVLTSTPNEEAKNYVEKSSMAAAIDFALMAGFGENEVVLMGGERVYREGLPYCDTLYLTELDGIFPGDTFFPEFARDEWSVEHQELFPMKEGQSVDYTFKILQRKGSSILQARLPLPLSA